MTWSNKHKFGILAVIFILVATPTLIAVISLTYKKPTCSDGILNQNEQGVDCGGVCTRVCTNESIKPITLWQLLFPVDQGIYTAAALVENPNVDAEAKMVRYVFKVFDEEGVPVYDREGTTYINAKEITPIIEPGIFTNKRIPSRVIFEIKEPIAWDKKPAPESPVSTRDVVISGLETSPRISATLINTSVIPVNNLEVIAVVYDTDGNAMGASRTLLDSIPESDSRNIVFTWPKPFPREYSKVDILPRFSERNLR